MRLLDYYLGMGYALLLQVFAPGVGGAVLACIFLPLMTLLIVLKRYRDGIY